MKTHQLEEALRALKLFGMLETLDARLAQASAGELGHAELVGVLCADEAARRDTAGLERRVKAARFEQTTTIEDYDFSFNPKIPAAQIRDLASLRFVDAGESVILHGPVGVGKSMIAQALGHAACRRGHSASVGSAPRCSPASCGRCCSRAPGGTEAPSSRHRLHAGRGNSVTAASGNSVTVDTQLRAEFGGWNLAQLRAERERLAAVLAAAPADVSQALTAAGRRRDALLAKRRTLEEGSSPGRRPPWARGWRRNTHAAEAADRRQMEGIDRSLGGLDARIESLHSQWLDRRKFLDEHAEEVGRLGLVRHAEEARELQVRTAARVSPLAKAEVAYGVPPTDPVLRQAWLSRAEDLAVVADGVEVSSGAAVADISGPKLSL